MIKREEKFPQGIELIYTILFGLSYFLDLYVYIGYKAVFFSESGLKKSAAYVEILALVLLLVFFLVTILMPYRKDIVISTRKLFWVGFLGQVGVAVVAPLLKDNETATLILRFVEAIALSTNLCAYLSIIGRNIGRKKRTWTVTLCFSLGFWGPACTGMLQHYECENWVYCLAPLVILCYGIYVFQTTKNNDIFGEKEKNNIVLNEDIKNILLQNHFWKTTFLLFLCGTNVQYTVRFILANSEVFFDKTTITQDAVYMFRYWGSSLGILALGGLSQYLAKRYITVLGFKIRWGSRAISYQISVLFGIVALFLLVLFDEKKDTVPVAIPYLIFFLLGGYNALWCTIFIQSLETFGRKIQPIIAFLLPIFLRIFWDFCIKYQYLEGIVAPDHLRIAIIEVGFILLLIGAIAAIFWNDNYEGGNMLNAYDDNFSRGFPTSIMNTEIRDKIVKIEKSVIRSENVELYIKQISEIVEPRMKEVFDTALYYYSFTFEQNDRYVITDPVVNQASLIDLKLVSGATIANFFKYLTSILSNKNYIGFAAYSFSKGKEGIVLAGNMSLITDKMKAEYDQDNYHFFDLSKIKLPKNDKQIVRFWNSLHGIDFNQEGATKRTNDLFEEIYEYIWQHTPKEAYNNAREIRRILALRALGSWLYPKGEYFIYILTPQSGVQYNFKPSLLLAMSNPIPAAKLSEIRDMLDYIMLQKAFAASLDAEWKKMAFQQSHALKTTLGNLKNKVDGLDEVITDGVELASRVKKISTVINMIDRVNGFNVDLMRYANNPDKAIELNPEPKGVSINNTLKLILDEIFNSIDSLRLTDEEHEEGLKMVLKKMCETEILLNEKVVVKVISIGFHILLLEILKNAFVFTNKSAPEVKITWNDAYSETHAALIIANNQKMKKESLGYINNNENYNEVKKIGITTMRSIVEFKRFNQTQLDIGEKGKWKIEVKTQENLTEFYLIIPKTDLTNV